MFQTNDDDGTNYYKFETKKIIFDVALVDTCNVVLNEIKRCTY